MNSALRLMVVGVLTFTQFASPGLSKQITSPRADLSTRATTHIPLPFYRLLSLLFSGDAPVASDDAYNLDEDDELIIPALSGILANDTDLEDDPLTVELPLVTEPEHGELTVNPDGSFSYSPDENYHGADTFEYRALDDTPSPSNIALVTLTIAPVNDNPTAVNDTGSLAEDGVLNVNAPGVLINDSDIDFDPISVDSYTQPAHGSVIVQANGAYSYTPTQNYAGSDSFTYTISDGNSGSATATVNLTVTPVNDAPQPEDDQLSVAEDGTLEIAASTLLGNDNDIENSPLEITAITQPAHGDLVDNLDETYTYTPDGNFFGDDTFTYTVSDGSATASATVLVEVTSVNDLPTAAADSYPATEDITLNISAPGLLGNDFDLEGPLTAVLLTPPAAGTLNLNANGSFTYAPAPNATGVVTFTYRAYDGLVYTASTTVTITLAAVNDTPIAGNDSASTNEDTPLNVAAPGVLSNDSDVESSVTAVILSPPAGGTLNLQSNGAYSYTPLPNANGIVTFTYRAYDGTLYSAPATVTLTINPVVDSPVAGDDTFGTNEDTPLVILESQLIANDSDGDSDPLNVISFTQPAHGSLTESPANTFNYTPALNFFGEDNFTYTVSDGSSTDTATVTINVAAINDTPTSAPDSYSGTEDITLNLAAPGVLSNDNDVEGPLTAVLLSAPATGTLTLNADGSFSYIPAANANGSITFTYRAYDGVAYSGSTTVTINLEAVNDAPVAVDDTASTNEDTTLTRSAPGVLTNDSDVDSAVTAVLVTPPAAGTLTLTPNGSYTYIPATNATGIVTFTYRAFDGVLSSNLATVTITVIAQPDNPVAQPDSLNVTEDIPLIFPASALLDNDSDPDGDILSVDAITDPPHGTIVDNLNGTFTYTPDLNYNGSDSFTYRAIDPTERRSAITTVSVTVAAVNDAPVAVADTYAATEDTTLNVGGAGVLANDNDLDSSITAVLFSPPAQGSLTLNSNGSFTYIPAPDANGPITFIYRAFDGELYSAQTTVTINIAAVNDAPLAVDDTASTNEDIPVNVSAPGVLTNDSDIDSSITAVLLSPPATGTLNFNSNGSYTYTPAANATGLVTFTYRAYDGSTYSAAATVSITINPVNDAPVAVANSYAATEDTLLQVSAPGVLGNDTDIENNPLSAALVAASGPQHGVLTFNPDGSFTYLPDPDFNGLDQFSYTASDGTDQSNSVIVTLNVAAVNDQPQAVADTFTTLEDTTLTVSAPGVLANDSDVDIPTTLTTVLVTPPATGILTLNLNGSLTYVPAANANGQVTFAYRANDGAGQPNSQSANTTVTINITAVNDAPVANDQNTTTPEDTARIVALTASDVDNPTLQYTIPARSVHGTLSGTAPNLTYTPDLNYNGSDTFTYTVSDGTLTDTATVTITVNPINDAPVGAADAYTINEDTPLVVLASGVLGNDSDVDNVNLTTASPTLPAHGSLTFNTNGSFTYSSALNYHGPDSFTYRVSDGSLLSNPVTVNITVNPINDLPLAVSENYSTNEDTPLIIPAVGVLANDSDVDGDTLTPIKVTDPASGSLVLNNDGSFTYTPIANYPNGHTNAEVNFTYRVFDGTASSNTVTVRITIVAVDDVPRLETDVYDVGQDGFLNIQSPGLIGNDSDQEDDPFYIDLVSDTANPNDTLVLYPDGAFDYTPYPNMVGSVTFTYCAKYMPVATGKPCVSTPQEVTINLLPPGSPQVSWLAPVFTGNVLRVGNEIVTLTVETSNCVDMCGVRFFRYDAINLQFIEIGSVHNTPYTITFDTAELNVNWNEILAVAVDPDAGFATSPRERILLKRYDWPGEIYRTYIPGASR